MDELPTVQHWVLCRNAKVIPPVGTHNHYTLRGVGYQRRVDPTVGISVHDPRRLKILRVFARFFGGAGAVDFEVQQWWMDHPTAGESGFQVEVFGPFTVSFRDGESVRDFVFALRGVPLVGVGRYQFRLVPLPSASDDEPLAVEHLEVVQP
jgi:hypothetical protein